jgi:hypothetical protein
MMSQSLQIQHKPYGFIYKTTLPDGRFYYGQHKIISYNTLDPHYWGSGVIIKDYLKSKGEVGLIREILEFGYSFDQMNELEAKYITEEVLLNPKNINLDKGGRKKFTRYPEVNARIGKTISELRTKDPGRWPSRKGNKNNKSVNWKLISPDGKEYIFCGGLKEFCKKLGISGNTIGLAVRQGWIPKRGVCAGWQAFNLDNGTGTTRDTLNHGLAHSGANNPNYKHKQETTE